MLARVGGPPRRGDIQTEIYRQVTVRDEGAEDRCSHDKGSRVSETKPGSGCTPAVPAPGVRVESLQVQGQHEAPQKVRVRAGETARPLGALAAPQLSAPTWQLTTVRAPPLSADIHARKIPVCINIKINDFSKDKGERQRWNRATQPTGTCVFYFMPCPGVSVPMAAISPASSF